MRVASTDAVTGYPRADCQKCEWKAEASRHAGQKARNHAGTEGHEVLLTTETRRMVGPSGGLCATGTGS
jgi:hypothetical protein